jgi:argininosuccinate lyase
MKMWSGRTRRPLDPDFEAWQRSFAFDRRLLKYECEASAAHARALKQANVLSADELRRVLEGLKHIGDAAAASPALLEDSEAEDVHHFIEKQLLGSIGETAYKLHTGRSRNEQIATDLRLYVRASCQETSAAISRLIAVLLDRAEQAGAAPMPAYTHMQPAEPVLVAHWLLAYVEMLFRDQDRIADCQNRANLCPLGSAAVAGSTLSVDRGLMARELGFSAPTANSIDATSDRDFLLEFLNALSLLALHLSRWAEDMLWFSSREYGFLSRPEAYSTGSSAMPQKLNADLLELTRAKAGRIIGDATALLITTKGLPLAYNKDLQETQEPLFHATETLLSLLPLITGWMQSVEFNFERLRAAAETGCMNAFAAATYLARQGVPFRIAHAHVGEAVRRALDRGCELEELPIEELTSIDPHFGDDVYDFLKLENVLAIHDVAGGTAPGRVEEALRAARRRVGAPQEEAHAHA